MTELKDQSTEVHSNPSSKEEQVPEIKHFQPSFGVGAPRAGVTRLSRTRRQMEALLENETPTFMQPDAPSVFGSRAPSTTAPTPSLFSQLSSTSDSQPSKPSPFGPPPPSTSTSGFSFTSSAGGPQLGEKAPTSSGGPGLFDGSRPPNPSLFGPPPPPTSTSIFNTFGTASSGGSVFGEKAPTSSNVFSSFFGRHAFGQSAPSTLTPFGTTSPSGGPTLGEKAPISSGESNFFTTPPSTSGSTSVAQQTTPRTHVFSNAPLHSPQLGTTSKGSTDDPSIPNGAAVQNGEKQISKDNEREKYEELVLFLKSGPYRDIEAGVYSDFKVKCFDKTFYLHRAIVCPQSPHIFSLLANGLYNKEEGLINFPDDDPRIFAMHTQLMYLRGLDQEKMTAGTPTILDHVKLYLMTKHYGDKATQKLALDLAKPRISEMCRSFQTDEVSTLLSNWDTFSEVVEYLYEHLHCEVQSESKYKDLRTPKPDDLLDYIIQLAAWNWRYIKANECDVKGLLSRVPSFAVELLSSVKMFSKEERAKMRVAAGEDSW